MMPGIEMERNEMDFGQAIKALKNGNRVSRGLERQGNVAFLFSGQPCVASGELLVAMQQDVRRAEWWNGGGVALHHHENRRQQDPYGLAGIADRHAVRRLGHFV